jgi:hypothetical protein
VSLRPPNVTPEWVELLEQAAAELGLPPEPWPVAEGVASDEPDPIRS